MKSIRFSLFDFGRPLLTSIKTQTTPNRSPTTLSWQNSPLVRLFFSPFPRSEGLVFVAKMQARNHGLEVSCSKIKELEGFNFLFKVKLSHYLCQGR